MRGAALFAVLDAGFLSLLTWRIKPEAFRASRSELIAGTALLFFGIWMAVLILFWDKVYSYLFPPWLRWLLPFFQSALHAFVAWLAWQATRWRRLNPILTYCLCGGLWGALSHVWAVAMGVVTKPPILQGAHPVAAVLVAFFEFTFYFCLVSAGAAAVHTLRERRPRPTRLAPRSVN